MIIKKSFIQFDLLVKRSSFRLFFLFYFSKPLLLSQLLQPSLLIISGKNVKPAPYYPSSYSVLESISLLGGTFKIRRLYYLSRRVFFYELFEQKNIFEYSNETTAERLANMYGNTITMEIQLQYISQQVIIHD